MSKRLVEEVIRMPPISMAEIEQIANEILGSLCPRALQKPTRIDLLHWVDYELPANGIHVTPVDEEELPDSEAETLSDGTTEIEIIIRRSYWEMLLAGGRRAHRPRATIGHELGHGVLHVPVIRRRRDSPQRRHLLQRVLDERIKVYENPEWQAWALGGCVLAPRTGIKTLPGAGVTELAEFFGVSSDFMRAHLRRLKIERGL
jgi:hypothetical protein